MRYIYDRLNERQQSMCDNIYDAYPRKVAPRYAKGCIWEAIVRISSKRRITIEESYRFLLDITNSYNEYERKRWKDGKARIYTPHPSTWFNQEGYLNEDMEIMGMDRKAMKARERIKEEKKLQIRREQERVREHRMEVEALIRNMTDEKIAGHARIIFACNKELSNVFPFRACSLRDNYLIKSAIYRRVMMGFDHERLAHPLYNGSVYTPTQEDLARADRAMEKINDKEDTRSS